MYKLKLKRGAPRNQLNGFKDEHTELSDVFDLLHNSFVQDL